MTCFLIGICWMASVGHWQCSLQLPSEVFSKPIWVSGKVTNLVHKKKNVRFNLKVSHIGGHEQVFSRKIRLSWQVPDWQLAQGQEVRLLVKLKPPHGLANEAGFNYQQWLFGEGIQATGYVKSSNDHSLINASQSLRQKVLQSLLGLELTQHKWILALAIGYRGLLQPEDWLLVQRTGIAHLIAISGLHLALVASLSYLVFGWLTSLIVSRVDRWHKFNVHTLTIVITVFTTWLYSGLAGFGLPTIRAWLMVCLLTGLFLFNKKLAPIKVLLLAMSGFVVLFPLSIFGASFWLSFSAVFVIWFVFWRWPVKKVGFSLSTVTLTMLRIQMSLSVLMLPVVAWQFSYVSVISPLVNLIAVPLVTFILVPLCLLGIICLPLNINWAEWIFKLVENLIEVGLQLLTHISQNDNSSFSIMALPILIWAIALMALVILFLPTFIIHKKWLVILMFPIISYVMPAKSKTWQVDVLDVGHGLSVLITKNQQAIIYDVGASYASGFNMADSVILPVLTARNIKQIDTVFISHSDNDHQGSLAVLSSKINIKNLVTNTDLCTVGYKKLWQGLSIQVLWPDHASLYTSNNSSCVLKISDNKHSVLLTGDIDKSIERQLVLNYGPLLKSDILIAPHHGSNTSSSSQFIHTVQPKYVVFSQGFMNRWGFPKPEVVTRYLAGGEPKPILISTSDAGQISFKLHPNDPTSISVIRNRQNTHHFWYANMPKCCAI
ncbi:DNA internalization-related competence protein ComEC/Rec2 [Paraglaciecola aquimarina]|uniref:DNA internalization-related competence protein ComEC/Rec2 n=1 Tax=Paraglaciecola algarum TaxID=3050085 RepID=A0ABS9D4N5_9ALTE|nr:DNA internalization-related competence protein ComEC/Rec2 [Paraglaciecola sp. G1-23]